MLSARIVIIGGGLSGLYAAHLLDKHGIRDYVLLEGRDRFGGRLLSPGGSQYDLGATWFWPDLQPELADVVRQLGLTTFCAV
ncbi:MAG: NAD(P)-binding protein [Gammaproteobacteria bacterium]